MSDELSAAAPAPALSPDYSAYFAREAERDRLDAELLPANKAALFGALAAAGIVTVVVTFDGYGDSGQIESVDARDSHGDVALPENLVEIATAPWDGSGALRQLVPVAEAIETLAYRFLEQTHCGWENNDGAYGEFTFDVAAQTITLDHNSRYTAVESYSHDW